MEWVRDEMAVVTDRLGRTLREVVPRITLFAKQPAGPLRLGLWTGDYRHAGWSVPWLPANAQLVIEGTSATGVSDGVRRPLPAFLRDWDGRFPRPVRLAHGEYRVTLDQHPDKAVDVLVEVTMTAMSE